ncbi:MAG: GGDEF domain-containing protein [Candidatus Acidiferrales bacterium]
MSVVKDTRGDHHELGRAGRRDAGGEYRRGKRPKPFRRRGFGKDDIETLFSALVLAFDSELGSVAREIDQLGDELRQNGGADELAAHLRPELWSAVKHAILERELRNLALTDDLTCLYNRRGFFAAATHQLKVSLRNMRGALLFIFNVENLQEVAGSFGDREADFMLVRTADLLEQTFRDSDILARLAADQFAAFATGTSGKCEQFILERLKMALRKCNESDRRYRISISMGKARFDPHRPNDLSQLIDEAGRANHRGSHTRAGAVRSKDIGHVHR